MNRGSTRCTRCRVGLQVVPSTQYVDTTCGKIPRITLGGAVLRNLFLCILSFLCVPLVAAARDNFLVIVADDLGVDSISAYAEGAAPVTTPTIDQLAAEGILFRNAYTNSQCAPTRAQILTGKHAFRTGIGTPGGAVLDLSETTVPEMLGVGYRNAAIGKWHIGPGADVDHPIDSGFEYFAGPLGNAGDYFSWDKTTNSVSTTGSTQSGFSTYITTDNADEAIAKIAEYGDDPWFVWLAFTAPHGPFHVPPSSLTTISVGAGSPNAVKYKAAIEAMDTEIGRVLASISPSVMADTTIIFLGDNGTPSSVTEAPFVSSHAKGSLYEGGINVPFIVKSPVVSVANQGSESAALVGGVDVFSTIADIAGITASTPDSVSIRPYLEDPTLATSLTRPYIYADKFEPNGSGPYTNEERSISDGKYKLIWRNGAYDEMFDLETDAFEGSNLLPVSGLTPTELAAYNLLVATMEGLRAAPECPATPDPSCLDTFEKGRLSWKERDGSKDKFIAKFLKGPALVQTDLGDPLPIGGTAYSYCLYDDGGALVASSSVARAGGYCDGKECWKSVGGDPPAGKGYKFGDKQLASDGMRKLIAKSGDAGRSKLILKGKGASLSDGVTMALSATANVTMQLHGSDATQCFSITLSEIVKQDPENFKAK